ncbi:glycosyltransferase family 2 protein [Geobacillus stearothermophilus]|uniref:glycosyltransferase n=1 Tax=Geobacillus stearothermophilus TaxID=1422 RepID=UPI003D24C550
MDKPLVSIIVLNFNSEQKTEMCLESLLKLEYDPINIILVDNSTNINSANYVKELAKKHSIDFIQLRENKGYAAGNKAGVDLALEKNAKYILVLNNDTIVDPSCVSNLVNAMEEDEDIAICGPILYDLEYQDNGYRTTTNLQSSGLKINPYTGRTISNKSDLSLNVSEHPVISGAALMFRAEIIKSFGFMEEEFFLYYEETDYCYSIKKACPHLKICTINNAIVWHEPSNNIDEKIYSLYYSHRNKIIFMRKHFKQTYILFLCFLFFFSIPKKILKTKKIQFIKTIIKGTIDGLKGNIQERI